MFKYIALFFKPTIFGIIITLLWAKVIRPLGIHEDTEITGNLSTNLFTASLFVPSIMMGIAFNQYRKTKALIHTAIAKKVEIDKDIVSRFREYIEMRIPSIMYIVMIVIDFFSLVLLALIDYRSSPYGTMMMFSASFIHYLFFMCCYELDDPLSGRFRAENVPQKLAEAVKDIEPKLIDKIGQFLF